MRKIAIYGREGIGKSTTTANISASLAVSGHNVLQVGGDPKRDSTRPLVGDFIPTILEVWRNRGQNRKLIRRDDVIFRGYGSVQCAEAGGPLPVCGQAGLGELCTIDILTDVGAFEDDFDFLFLDDVDQAPALSGAGAAEPVEAEEIYVVTSGEFHSLCAANNIAKEIRARRSPRFSRRKGTLAGIIGNLRGLERERELLEEFALRINVPLVHCITRDTTVGLCGRMAQTVVEAAPESDVASQYRTLARKIAAKERFARPTPMTLQDLSTLCSQYS